MDFKDTPSLKFMRILYDFGVVAFYACDVIHYCTARSFENLINQDKVITFVVLNGRFEFLKRILKII